MRKSSCWMILVALLTITAPTAFADSLSIVFTGGTTTPVDTIIAFTPIPAGGLLDLGPVTEGPNTYMFTAPLNTTANPQNDTYDWIFLGFQFILTDSATGTHDVAFFSSGTPFKTDDTGKATVTLNTVAVPEPSPVVLTLVGLGLLVVMRKR